MTDNLEFERLYNYSEMRHSLFNWYEFEPNSELLEIGAEKGALTGLFCQRCKNVISTVLDENELSEVLKRYKTYNNLTVTANDWRSIVSSSHFDYIVVVCKLEYMCGGSKSVNDYKKTIREIFSALKHNGTLLVVFENRYGLKYFCGERDPVTLKPFAGLNRYPDGSVGYMLSRAEVLDIVRSLDCNAFRMYYPVPDYIFPQLIYTDNIQPGSSLKERIVNYYRDKSTLVMSEKRMYDDITENGVFPFFSNSFLVECTKKRKCCNIDYAALSTDRGPEHGYVTAIHSDNTVTKTPLYPQGIKGIGLLKKNADDIASHGCNVVAHSVKNDRIIMDKIELPTLSSYLKSVIRSDPDEFIRLFDRLYEEVLRSSERAEILDEALVAINPEKSFWTPVMRKVYFDMIPINAFYERTTDKLIFYDQEFVRDNFSAGYTMFRAIFYTYIFIPFAEEYVPKSVLIKRFGLSDHWNIYSQIEAEFVSDNRDMKKYSDFWKLGDISSAIIKENIDRLDPV